MARAVAAEPAPTSVPRNLGVTDGPWDLQDDKTVKAAILEASTTAVADHAGVHAPHLLCAPRDCAGLNVAVCCSIAMCLAHLLQWLYLQICSCEILLEQTKAPKFVRRVKH